jgi:hypothetical protein
MHSSRRGLCIAFAVSTASVFHGADALADPFVRNANPPAYGAQQRVPVGGGPMNTPGFGGISGPGMGGDWNLYRGPGMGGGWNLYQGPAMGGTWSGYQGPSMGGTWNLYQGPGMGGSWSGFR